MKKLLEGILQKMYARRDARLAALGELPAVSAAPTPQDAGAAMVRGEAAETAGDFEGALNAYRDVLRTAPTALAHVCAGNALYALGRLEEAEGHYRAAIDLESDYAAAYLNLGNVLFGLGEPGDAESAYRQALRARPDWVEAYAGLGRALEEQDLLQDAETAYRSALKLDPSHMGIAVNLASALRADGRAAAARDSVLEALRHAPDARELNMELAVCHSLLGDAADAIAVYDRLLARDPDDLGAASSRLLVMNFLPGQRSEAVVEEHRRWGARLAKRVAPATPQRDRDPVRALRVGYVSADFRRHPVAQFVAPLLEHHDRDSFEIFAYAGHARADDITQQLRELTPHFREVYGAPDEALAQLIEEDRIDLLVDLSGHTDGNRLGVFARRPAPVQLTWLGYLGTTGLPAMDYRICDAHTDPPGAETLQTETPLRLPASQWCYANVVEVAPGPSPLATRGYVTFGSFNQPAKLNEPLLRAWAALMKAVPRSRLRIAAATDPSLADRYRGLLGEHGIAADRIDVIGRASVQQYLEGYRDVDIALDSFPYTGGTTTCDALSMGVPVATVAGDRAVQRSGVSLLNSVGLADWIAPSLEALPALVQRHLADPAALARLRAELPGRMRASPLMDGPRFARDMESIFREAWRRWCERSG